MKKATDPSVFYVENYLQGFINDPVATGFPAETSGNDENLSDLNVEVKDEEGENGAVLLEKPR